MSSILWSKSLVPGTDMAEQPLSSEYYGDSIRIPRTKALSIDVQKAALPDRKAFRSMSRAAVLLSLACLDGIRIMQPYIDVSPFDIGIYCAIENGPLDLGSTLATLAVSRDEFAEEYKRVRNPKFFLKQVPNLAPAQAAIFLGIMGPINVYNHSFYGSVHALDQAELDIQEKRVKAALVCSAFSFEDPLVLERINRKDLNERVLCEGAGAMLLTAGNSFTDWDDYDYQNTESYYGISHQLIIQTLSEENS
jgi:hypothetical protein